MITCVCGCEQGGDCTKTSMCQLHEAVEMAVEGKDSTIEDLETKIQEAIATLRNDLFKTRVKNALAILEAE